MIPHELRSLIAQRNALNTSIEYAKRALEEQTCRANIGKFRWQELENFGLLYPDDVVLLRKRSGDWSMWTVNTVDRPTCVRLTCYGNHEDQSWGGAVYWSDVTRAYRGGTRGKKFTEKEMEK